MNITEHLLVCLAEEASEIGQIVGKALRFGLDDVNVLNPTGPTNRQRLISELHDLMAVVELLDDEGELGDRIFQFETPAIDAKQAKVRKFMEYARSKGTLK